MTFDGHASDSRQKGHIFGTAVEVLALEQDVWYLATLLHLSRPGWVAVQVGGVKKELGMNQVRLPPQPKDDDVNEVFVPKLNDLVEVQMPATSSKPPCMLSGAIRMARGAYFLVSLLGRGRSDDILVTAEQLREPGQTTLLSSCLLQEEVFELPQGFIEPGGEDPLTSDLKEWLLQFQKQSCILSLELRFTAFGAELKLAGERSKMSLAGKMLHCVHMRSWSEIAKRRSGIKDMESQRSYLQGFPQEEGKCLEFVVDSDIMRLVLGRTGGKRLQELQDSLGVSIEVRYDHRKKHHCVRVVGQDPEAVANTQRQLQYRKKDLSFPKHHLGFVLGKQLGNIQEIAEKVGLLSIRFDPQTEALEMIGLSDQLESAEMLIQAHLDYREVYEEMQQEHGALTQSFQALDDEYRMRKGKGKGHPTRQYRARTPPPTAKMFAMGRLQKPAHRDDDVDWRGSKNRANSSSALRTERLGAKGAGKEGNGGAKGGQEVQEMKEVQERNSRNDEVQQIPAIPATEMTTDEQELLPDARETEPHTDTPELDEDSESDNAVPSFLFDSSP